MWCGARPVHALLAGAWSAGVVDVGDWMTIDAGSVAYVYGVRTQKRPDASPQQYVTQFTVQCSTDGASWSSVDGGTTFDGPAASNGANDAVDADFEAPVFARYIRITVQAFSAHPSMRAGLLGPGLAELRSTGHGATAEVAALSGTTSSQISFGAIIESSFTVCSVTRYTGGSKARILNAGGANWLHGHYNGLAGVAYYNGWKTAETDNVSPDTDWVVMCGKNAGFIVVNNVDVGIATGGVSADVLCGGHRAETCALCPFSDGTINGAFYGAGWCNGDCSWDAANNNCVTPSTGGLSLWVNGGAYIETSDFAIAELIVWPRCLTSEEMYSMSAQLMDSLTSTSPPPPPSPPTSPPPPPSPAFERCDIGVWDNHHGHDCDSYVRHGFCCGSGACPHHEWTLGQPFNYPEKHCCACSPQVKTPGVTCDVAEHRRGTAAYVHTASVHETLVWSANGFKRNELLTQFHETLVWSANGFKRNELLTTIATARSMAENAEQKRLFTAALQKQCGDEDKERSQFLTERKYEEVCAVLEEWS